MQMIIGRNSKKLHYQRLTKYRCDFCLKPISSKNLRSHDFRSLLILCSDCKRIFTIQILDINPSHLTKYVGYINKKDRKKGVIYDE
jgi:hypothetical protein